MSGFFGLFSSGAPEIGVDLGSASLKLAQVSAEGGAASVTAAARCDLPPDLSRQPKQRIEFFVDAVRGLLRSGDFRGRRIVLGLPASIMYVERVRLPALDDASTAGAIAVEIAGKVPFPPSAALIRHLVAGEVYEDSEPRNELVVLAARRDFADQLMESAARAKLEVACILPEPLAVARCFAATTPNATAVTAPRAVVDFGAAATRIYIVEGNRVRFARVVPVGLDALDAAVAGALKCDAAKARSLRIEAGQYTPAARKQPPASTSAGAPVVAAAAAGPLAPANPEAARLAGVEAAEAACRGPLSRLTQDLRLSLQYFSHTFGGKPVERLDFIGGATVERRWCAQVAAGLGLRAAIGDPLCLAKAGDAVTASNPAAWCVAAGLSLSGERAAALAAA